ncbi:PAS domain S-box protein [Gigaspora margarita]|uniref:PAS domain S-box protein n=2 Tax=Gigaspora margarita TaxID=4874 RepID=A0A8H4AX71_GIGMA|nr:PAS domain S-box protein [Gigaspora margarita]
MSTNNNNDEMNVVDFIKSYDWSSTPLGPMDLWDPLFRSAVDFCCQLKFPSRVVYGSDLIVIYNQEHVLFEMKKNQEVKHPFAMGKPIIESYPEYYELLKTSYEQVKSTGKGFFQYDGCVPLLHNDDYIEESYFNFAMSPIFKTDGSFCAMLCIAFETTDRVLNIRRKKSLNDMGIKLNECFKDVESLEDTCNIMVTALRGNDKDFPFALIYLVDNNKLSSGFQPHTARLVATTFNKEMCIENISNKLLETFETIDLSKNPDENYDEYVNIRWPTSTATHQFLKCSSWPIHLVVKEEDKSIKVCLKDGKHAILFPIKTLYDNDRPLSAILICGINPRIPLEDGYMKLFELVVNRFSLALTRSISRRDEKKHLELLADLNRQKIKIFQNLSHELLNPLALTLSPLEEAISSCTRESIIHSHLQTVQRNTRRLLKLVSILLQYSNIEGRRYEAQFLETDIAKFTQELAANFNSIAKILGLDYIIDIPNPEEFKKALGSNVYIDHEMFEAIFFNLCSNAFKNTWSGQIRVRLYIEHSNEIILEVSDTGVGISEINLSNLFQRFYRVNSQQSRSHEGTGIGLALVKELITHHGGDITVTSKIGQGTTFKCRFLSGYNHLPKEHVYHDKKGNDSYQEQQLYTKKQLYLEENLQWLQYNSPIIDKENQLDTKLDSKSIDNNKILTDNSPMPSETIRHKILLVEDNADMRNYLNELLKKEFDVCCAYDGRDAMNILSKLSKLPDLILSDVMMPNINGYELVKMIRSNIKTRLIPFILLTAKAYETSGLDYGADDYIIKPFKTRELMARIRTNINLSQLRNQLITQQCKEEEINQLLISISNNLLFGLDLEETFSKVVKDIHKILQCDRVFVISCEPSNHYNSYNSENKIQSLRGHTIIALSEDSSIKNEYENFEIFEHSKFKTCQEEYDDPKGFKVKVFSNTYCIDFGKQTSMLFVRIKVDTNNWGWIKAHRPPNSTWHDLEINLFQQVADQIDVAISYAQLSKEKLLEESRIKSIKAADDKKSLILANVSHELRTPLGTIIGILSSFENENLSNRQKNMIKIMENASDTVLSIVNNMLNAVNLEEHKNILMNKSFDLLNLFENTIERFDEKAGNKQIELILSYELDTFPRYVKGDPESLKQILINLLSNAISHEFMKNIWKDGILNINASKIEQQDGTGFGLMTCKQLVEINEGKIGVESQLGKGSKFWFTWNVEIIPIPTNQTSSIESMNHNLNRIVFIHPLESVRNAIAHFFKNSIKVELFDTYDQKIETARHRKALHNQPSYTIIFINLDENNADEIPKVALELKEIYGDDLLIILMAFSNANERTLVKKLIKEIGGQITSIFKPITPKKLITHCLQNNLKRNIGSDIARKYGNFRTEVSVDNNVIKGTPRHRLTTISNNDKIILKVDNTPINLKNLKLKSENIDYSTLEITGQETFDHLLSEFKSLKISDLSTLKDKLE